MRSRYGMAMATGVIVAVWTAPAAAQAVAGGQGAAANFLTLLTERFEFTFSQLPALGDHMIGEVAAGAADQSARIQEVNGSVSKLDHMTQQNAALVEQSAAAAESLREQSQLLSGAVAQFRLEAQP